MTSIDSYSRVQGCHSWELQDQPVAFCRRFGTVSIFPTGSSRFSAACDRAGMKINTENTKVLCLPTNPMQCMLQVSGNTLQQEVKFKHLGVVFASDGRWS